MRLGLGTVVETKHADDDAFELGRDHDRTGAAAVGAAAGMVIFRELHAEGLAQLFNRAREPHAAAGRARLHHHEVVGLRNSATLAISSAEAPWFVTYSSCVK